MPAVSIPSNPAILKPDDADFEPDDEWKRQLRKRIEESLTSMVKEVKENQAAQLRKQVVTEATRLQLEEEYKQAMVNITTIANEQYRIDLDRERNQRRWTAGKPINPEWTRILAEEQQSIMNTIRQNTAQDDKTASPTDERRPTPAILLSNESTTLPTYTSPVIPAASPSVTLDPQREHDKRSDTAHDSPRSGRRASGARGKHPRQDRTSSIRRKHGPSNSRSSNDPESPDTAESDELHPPLRSRTVPDPLSLPENNRWDTSLGRAGSLRSVGSFTARSPPKALPEVWKPATPLEDDALTAKSYHLGRRGSSASIKSTGSGAGVRPVISATIPERVDDTEDSGFVDRSNHERERSPKYNDKDRRLARKKSRPVPVDPTNYTEEPLQSSAPPLKPAGSSVVMQLATSPGPLKSLTSKTSFVNGDERYYRDQHHSTREPPYRDSPYSSRDISSRPVLSRSPYSPDDRDHSSPYSHRPPKTPFREYPHHHTTQSSYHVDERRRDRDWDVDRERDWEDEYRERDRDPEYRDREWDRDYDNYAESRNQYPYPPRSATYPTPPSSAPRPPPSHDDVYDDREPPSRTYGYRPHALSSSPTEDWEYPRLESSRPVPTRQPSYSRRDDPDRDQYARPYSSSSNSIPITPRHAPSSEESNGPSWKDWGEPRRVTDPRYDGYTRSPPNAEPLSRRRQQYYHDETPRNEGPPPAARRKNRPPHLAADSRQDRDYRRDKEGDHSDEEEESSDQSGSEDGSEELDRDLEEQTRRLEEERKETDWRIREKALEIKRLQEEEQRLEEEAKRKEEEVKRKEEEVRRKDEEAHKVEQELQKKREEEAKRLAEEERKRKEETRRKEREMKQKEQDANRKIENANKMVLEAGRKAEEAKKKEVEINRKEEQTRRKEEKLKEDAEKTRRLQLEANRIAEQARVREESLRQMEEETRKKEQDIEERERALKAREDELKRREEEARMLREEARRLEEEAWRKEEDTRKKEAEVRRKEQETRRKEEETRRKEEEARRKEEEARRKEETRRKEERRKEEEARRREEEARRREEEARKKEEETRKQEEEVWRKEEARRREDETRRREEARKREDEAARHRREPDPRRVDTDRFFEDGLEDVDVRFVEEQARLLQQAQYRKREEEIKRNRQERKRQDSIGNDSAWTSSSTSPGMSKTFPPFANAQVPPYSSPSPAPSISSAAWTTWGTPSKPSNVTTPASAARSAAAGGVAPLNNKPRNGSISSGSHPISASPLSSTPISESEWARRHAEFTNDQQERFRREQEKMETERQLRAAGKPLSRDEIQRVFEHHERLWSRLPSISELTWVDFPWPVFRLASTPEDISFALVNAYFSTPFLPEREKAKSLKDRIKEHLRRWHPDRFESKVLPRVVEPEKEKVKQGAGNVVRYLNDLLRKENETGNGPSLFGD